MICINKPYRHKINFWDVQFQISVHTADILTDFVRCIHQSLQAHVGIVPQIIFI